jgi:hypothetical protein
LPQAAVGTYAVAVTVKVIPENAVIFRAGEKLGAGAVRVNVERNAKQRLTALHDGYAPYNFTLDGSRDTVTVRLKRTPRPRAEAAHVGDSPFEGRSEDSNGAAPASSPADTAPESTPPAAPSPNTSSGETPAD